MITDAYVVLQVYSSTLSLKELQEVTKLTPTDTGEMGVRPRPRSVPRPANYVRLSTETLTDSKDLNDHLRMLRAHLPDGRFIDRLDLANVEVFCTVYWRTTEDVKFSLSAESLVILSQIGVETEFNLMVDPSPLSCEIDIMSLYPHMEEVAIEAV